jgi:1-deoxy-D-xylulose-5-phosphate reductoisomerase
VSVVVLGSTGSIGTQALEILAEHPERFEVVGLACAANAERLAAQARAHRVRRVALADRGAAARARDALGAGVEVLDGDDGVNALAGCGADIVLNGLVGSRGLRPTLAALGAGSRLALANKESLVLGGRLVLEAARPGQIVPVDSEHSALAQCLRSGGGGEVARLVVTASGGPFRGWSRAELARVTPRDALAHPTWSMGSVITVNSATLANKGLEVIEAHLLFGVAYDAIEVVVHPQSVVHGMVEFRDGATLAKLSPPDMRLPIQLALGWPERLDHAPARMDWTRAVDLHFEPVDAEAFPMLGLAVEAGRRAGAWPGVYNAANEEAVAAFLGGRLRFLGIPAVVEATLESYDDSCSWGLEALLEAEGWARRHARERVADAAGED